MESYELLDFGGLGVNNYSYQDDRLERDRQINVLLERCLDLPESEHRRFLVETVDDTTLIEEVLELLNEDLGDFLETPLSIHDGPKSELGILSMIALARSAMDRGAAERARTLLEEALKADKKIPTSPLTRAAIHQTLGDLCRTENRRRALIFHFEQAIRLLESTGDPAMEKELNRLRFERTRAEAPNELPRGPESVLDLLG